MGFPRFVLASLLFASTLCAADVAPEPASGWTAKKLAHAGEAMVAAAHPLATDAGVAILKRGGNAIDAMVAVQLVLGLVEPGSSGIGGGAYLMYYEAHARAIRAIDARETAPAAATPDLFLEDGKPMPFQRARIGGRAVGVPGVPRMLEAAHSRYGKLPWKTLFEPAIALAEKGFAITPRLVRVASGEEGLADEPGMRGYLFDESGKVKPAGTVVRNPAYAVTLRAMAEKGADAFYTGEIAADIVAAVRSGPNPGRLSLEDLASYRVRDVEPLCVVYRVEWRLCGVPPSSSGGISVLQVLGELNRFDLNSLKPGMVAPVHLISEAERLAFADRNRYVADDRFVAVPVEGLLDPGYLSARSRMIRLERSMGVARAGSPGGAQANGADDTSQEASGTTHFSIVDRDGNAVSLTSSVESGYGSHRMVRGFVLNNQLTDFSFEPVHDGAPVANSVAPGKRPRSSMAPFLVFDETSGRFEMAIGSPGGSHIIAFVVKALIATLYWGMDVQAAIDLPNFGSRNGPTELEAGTELERLVPSLKAMAHDVRLTEMTSGTHAVRRAAGGWDGGADPRREGVARGY